MRLLLFPGYFYGKYVEIISLKAPGNYLDRFWSNKIAVLLLERPTPNMFMISGFLTPGGPLFMDLDIPNYFNKYKKKWKHFRNIFFL